MDKPCRGSLTVVSGSMFAGKTERLIAFLRDAQRLGRHVRAFKHCIDDRYCADHLITHADERFPAVRVADAGAILEQCHDVECVAIDEGQFFKPVLVDVVRQLLESGKHVMIAGISHDAWGRPFDPMPQLAEMADSVEAKLAPCRVCGKPAEFTQRMVPVTTPTMVGGLESYEPRCQDHFTPLEGSPEQP